VLLLNDTGAAILELCDGRRTVVEIAVELGARYGGSEVLADVTQYLDALEVREMVHDAR
jgi:pyrroloquinoline quinone biosynthesis protein D